MNPPSNKPEGIFEQALRWIEALKEGAGDRAAFFAWLAESPRHAEELTFALALSEEIAGLSAQQREELEALAADVGDAMEGAMEKVVAWKDSRPSYLPADVPGGPTGISRTAVLNASSMLHPESPPRVRSAIEEWKWGVAAGLASTIVAAVVWIGFFAPNNHYVTGVGEQRTLQLDDGSIVHLNVRSRLELHFTRTARELRLRDGEALFKVARDASRPFRVYADETVIHALGTQFNVHRRPSGTVVSVIEGTVRVRNETLAAGEEVQFEDSGKRLAKRAVADLRNVTAWRQHRLVFQDETLADIAAEFNRYNIAPQIRVEGDVARARHFAGTFDADAPQALIEALQADTALVLERAGEEIVIRSR